MAGFYSQSNNTSHTNCYASANDAVQGYIERTQQSPNYHVVGLSEPTVGTYILQIQYPSLTIAPSSFTPQQDALNCPLPQSSNFQYTSYSFPLLAPPAPGHQSVLGVSDKAAISGGFQNFSDTASDLLSVAYVPFIAVIACFFSIFVIKKLVAKAKF